MHTLALRNIFWVFYKIQNVLMKYGKLLYSVMVKANAYRACSSSQFMVGLPQVHKHI
jgi:hypothetical protein